MRRTVALLAALAVAGCGVDTDNAVPEADPATEQPARVSQAEPQAQTKATPKPRPPKVASRQWLSVVGVVDGDTIKVRAAGNIRTVRLIGVDTPETKDPNEPVGCYGPEASAYARKLLDGQRVRLQADPSQDRVDRYGRTLAYVWLRNGRMVNEELIRAGYGREYTYDKPYRHQHRFRTAQSKAKAADAGIWSHCQPKPKPKPKPKPTAEPALDPQFDTCGKAIDAGYGPYSRGKDPEYDWYRDADSDGVVCES
jgi:micrococcal nuclease